LLQRILYSGENVTTLPETWFLLGLASFNGNVFGMNEVGYEAVVKGLKNFESYIGGDGRLFAQGYVSYKQLLEKRFPDSEWFVEKTPRNIFICNDIINSLHQGDKVIYIDRCEADIFKSYLEYFDRFPYFKSFKYSKEIISAKQKAERLLGHPDTIVIDFEKLVQNTGEVVQLLERRLGISGIDIYSLPKLPEGFGDKKGGNKTQIYAKTKKRKYVIDRLADYYFFKRINFIALLIVPISFLIYRFNLNIFQKIYRNDNFIH
jgi:hypothetical protein